MQVNVISNSHVLQLQLVAETPTEQENLTRILDEADGSVHSHLIYSDERPVKTIKVKLEG